jgi:hypothetical protein
MPARKLNESPYELLRNQAQATLQEIQGGIRSTETQLADLRQQEQEIQSFLGKPVKEPALGRPVKKAASEGGPRARIDWGAVLSKLPKQFTAADVRKVRGLAEKKASEIFAAITRWINTKLVRRKDRGVYERVE